MKGFFYLDLLLLSYLLLVARAQLFAFVGNLLHHKWQATTDDDSAEDVAHHKKNKGKMWAGSKYRIDM